MFLFFLCVSRSPHLWGLRYVWPAFGDNSGNFGLFLRAGRKDSGRSTLRARRRRGGRDIEPPSLPPEEGGELGTRRGERGSDGCSEPRWPWRHGVRQTSVQRLDRGKRKPRRASEEKESQPVTVAARPETPSSRPQAAVGGTGRPEERLWQQEELPNSPSAWTGDRARETLPPCVQNR